MTATSTTKRFALLLALMAAMLLACAGAASAQTQTLTSTVQQSGFDDFNPNPPVPINGSPYDYSGQEYASLGSIDQVSITLRVRDGDTAPGEFPPDGDRDQLTLGLDGIDTGIKLNDFPSGNGQETTQTITGVPNNAADILTALQADGQLNATVIDQSPGDNSLGLPATSDTTLELVGTTADTTPPDISVSHTADGTNGWNKTSPVTVNVSASDTGSGLAADPTCTDTIGTTTPLTLAGSAGSWTTSVSGDGTHNISCSVSDNEGNSASDTETVMIDTNAPSVSCSVSPSTLRVPANNHKLVTVTASVSVTDSGASGTDPISTNRFTLVSVTSDQAQSGLAKDDVPNDIQGWTTGPNSADTIGKLRAERYGTARTYTLTYQGKDLAGNTKNCQATVTVPKGG